MSEPVRLGLARELRDGRLARLAAGRRAHIGFFATRCCTAVTVGDLTVSWEGAPIPDDAAGVVSMGSLDGVPISADPVLLPVLARGDATLVLAGPVFARRPAVRLGRPEIWLDFLGGPGAAPVRRSVRPAGRG